MNGYLSFGGEEIYFCIKMKILQKKLLIRFCVEKTKNYTECSYVIKKVHGISLNYLCAQNKLINWLF